jgi:hypothetical protein
MLMWMRHRGHGPRAMGEMAAAMAIPTAGVIALLAVGIGDFHGLMMAEHIAMFPLMLVAMLLRREEYSRDVHAANARREHLA